MTNHMPPAVSGIYKIVNNVNQKYYVGSARNIAARWSNHKAALNSRKHHNPHLLNAWHHYGAANFSIVVVESVPFERLLEVEQNYLNECAKKPGEAYNMIFVARGSAKISQKLKGRPLTAEHRRKIGEANLGRVVSPETRKKIGIGSALKRHTAETKRKIGDAGKGRQHSVETKAKIAASNKGKHSVTPSRRTRLKISVALKGKHVSTETKAKIRAAKLGKPRSQIYLLRNELTNTAFLGTRPAFQKRFGIHSYRWGKLVKNQQDTVAGWSFVSLETSHEERMSSYV